MVAAIEHRQVAANGILFRVAVSGPADAPAILCLHGFPEGSMSWGHVMALLPRFRIYAPDLRGYPGTTYARDGYDVFTLTDDIRALIAALGLVRPTLVSHDWGGALGWIFAHRYSDLISRLLVVNCTHPRTLVRAVLTFQYLQPFRIFWVPPFQVPFLPEFLLSTRAGRAVLWLSFVLREGRTGTMDRALVTQLVDRFQHAADMRGPIQYYRAFVRTYLSASARGRLYAIYDRPIAVPVTLVWGMKDGALPYQVAMQSHHDAGCPVEWRPLDTVGHFVDLEAWALLTAEIERAVTT
jgi:pimeloyl-ACP methyl ester carboxylesterase